MASEGSDFKCKQGIGISLTDEASELVKSQVLVSVFTVVCKSDSLKTVFSVSGCHAVRIAHWPMLTVSTYMGLDF